MRFAVALLIVLPLAVGIGGCGGDDEDGADTATSDVAVPDGVVTQYRTIEREVAAEGGETTAGDWHIAYIVEPAEPWFDGRRFREPAPGETHHIEILPIERATGRLVPYVPVSVQVLDPGGGLVDEDRLDFFYAEFFHYAQNFSIPRNGKYTLRARIGAPAFLRHGEQGEGPELSQGATVQFEDVPLSG